MKSGQKIEGSSILLAATKPFPVKNDKRRCFALGLILLARLVFEFLEFASSKMTFDVSRLQGSGSRICQKVCNKFD